jgi:lysophospholipase L1-like esterase
VIDRNQPLPYELHSNKFFSFKKPLRLNNYGHFGADFTHEKPPRTIRIACLGASSTANNIADSERDYSYPGMLEEMLNQALAAGGRRAEVMNCGIGGWTSADIFINFTLNILPLKPDYVVLYHGFNDLHLHLMDDFLPDYSHGRRNLGEVLHLIRRAYYLPKFRHWHLYEWTRDRLLGTGNVRNDLLRLIAKKPSDIRREFADLRVQQALLRNLLVLCRHHGIHVVLGSFCQFAYDPSALARKYAEGVRQENVLMAELATEFGLPLVDQAKLLPQDRDYFVDAVHFTPTGMRAIATNFADALVADMRTRGLIGA